MSAEPRFAGAPRLRAEIAQFLCEGPVQVRQDEPLSVRVRLSLGGELRQALTPEAWARAHEAYDEHFTLRYALALYSKGPLFARRIAGPVRLRRRATFYWSRDPLLPYRIWVMVVDEAGVPRLPKDVEEARAMLMDVEWTFALAPGALARGARQLFARVRASWGRHSFADKGSVEGASPPLRIEVL